MKLRKFIATTLPDYLNENIIAYHGTGVNFNAFSNEFNGTGIMNNGFGYGIYLTNTRKNAKGWAESLEKPSSVIIDGVKQSNNIEKFLTNAVDTHGNHSDILLHILKIYIDRLLKDNQISEKEYKFIENSKKLKLTRNRFIYEVEIIGEDFIYWNRPISIKQIEKVKSQAKKENKNLDIIVNDNEININNNIIRSGEDFYYSLRNMIQKEKSAFLNRSGIVGVKYDENYVIFNPDKNIIIKKKRSF